MDNPLLGNRSPQIYHTPEQKNYGNVAPKNQVRFRTEREAQQAGYRRAAHDHYGPGTGVARTARPAGARLAGEFQRLTRLMDPEDGTRARRPQRAAACRGTRTRPGHELVNAPAGGGRRWQTRGVKFQDTIGQALAWARAAPYQCTVVGHSKAHHEHAYFGRTQSRQGILQRVDAGLVHVGDAVHAQHQGACSVSPPDGRC